LSEFAFIQRYFAPLAGAGGLGLRDDAALLPAPATQEEWVITQDAMTAGVHFFADDPAAMIAQKLLRVNLSDLAAKGAKPMGYLLSLLLPPEMPEPHETWIAAFTEGLAIDQKHYGIQLLGGDTSRIHGGITLSLTAIGVVPTGTMLTRSGARAGDGVFVTGTIGDAALGLTVRREGVGGGCQKVKDTRYTTFRHTRAGGYPEHKKDEIPVSTGMTKKKFSDAESFVLQRYLLPQPRLALGQGLRGIASAAMDISDGLLQDAGHLATTSQVTLQIEQERIPLSWAAQEIQLQQNHQEAILLTGGDDYEILFTAPLEKLPLLQRLAAETDTPITCIGRVIPRIRDGVQLLDATGNVRIVPHAGWQHF
jgi:thiamine-monophosphate kinase